MSPRTSPTLPLALALLAAAILTMAGCTASSEPTAAAASPAPSAKITTVAVAKPSFEKVAKQVVMNGEFKPYQVADLHSKIAGYLKKLNVDVGDRVKEGQLLASLEVPEMEAELAHAVAERNRIQSEVPRARAELEKAEANLQLARVALTRLANVSKSEPGLVAQQEVDEAEAKRRAAEAQVSSSKASLGVIEKQIESARASEERIKTMAAYTKITAPFSGVIMRRFADVGALIQAGTASQTQALPLVRIADTARLRLSLVAPEWTIPHIRPGQLIDIKVTALNKTIQGHISRATGDVLQSSRTMELEADVANPGDLAPGMYAEVVLTLQRNDKALTVPVEAIGNNGGNRVVYVVNNANVIEEHVLKTGIEGAARIEVVEGIGESDSIIISNRSLLRPGQTVEPKFTAPN